MRAHEEFCDAGCGGDDGLLVSESEELGEVLKVVCVGAMGALVKPVVTDGQVSVSDLVVDAARDWLIKIENPH